jgi:hypothetical protein
MEEASVIMPLGTEDRQGAERAFKDFFALYQPTLVRVEQHLKRIVDTAPPIYAETYRPWLLSLRDLIRGVYLTTRNISVPNPEAFAEALKMFSFKNAIEFLEDLCAECRLALSHNWSERFREHINTLLFSAAILNRSQAELVR